MEQSSSYSSYSLSVLYTIITVTYLCMYVNPGPVVDISYDGFHSGLKKDLPFPKVFSSIAMLLSHAQA